MKVIRALGALAACGALVSGCGTATTTGSTQAPTAATRVASGPDLLTLLPDPSAYPAYLAAVPSLVPLVTTVDGIADASTWNLFGVLVPNISYQPASCTATRNPDVAPYSGSFALDFHDFEDKSNVQRADQANPVGATVARGTVDEASVHALAEECATVTTSDAIPTRFKVLPNPKADANQVLAIQTTVGRSGDIVKLTYVARVSGYTVTAYAVCGKVAVCQKALTPVFRSGVAKVLKAGPAG